ncbi:hypothetical protein Clacol_005305 [Clathrus columnatus]|uniref:Uncharacterized protein n=1 Tax=Clathrus columnatus TaxID=1419009 RepID=A0AAV5AD13_9AGAM|nr:hypothetical protein Clacol_005305 [Clathrus columnatus]
MPSRKTFGITADSRPEDSAAPEKCIKNKLYKLILTEAITGDHDKKHAEESRTFQKRSGDLRANINGSRKTIQKKADKQAKTAPGDTGEVAIRFGSGYGSIHDRRFKFPRYYSRSRGVEENQTRSHVASSQEKRVISQFLEDVDWGELDWLVVDTPPGTSDEHLSIVQYLKESGIDGAVVITTPQEVAIQDVRREIDFCRKVGIKVIGVVENMAGFVCPGCKTESQIFKPTTGGAKKLAEEMGIELLGSVPLDPRIGKSADYGVSFLDEYPDSPATKAYMDIIQRLRDKLD